MIIYQSECEANQDGSHCPHWQAGEESCCYCDEPVGENE